MDPAEIAFFKFVVLIVAGGGITLSFLKLRLRHKVEMRSLDTEASVAAELAERNDALEQRVAELEERLDFVERRLVRERVEPKMIDRKETTPV